MKINTGKTPITVTALIAVLSLSLIVNLPGLAVTPMLATLSKIFPGATQLEQQLLTILPNLLIIPFVLVSGKLSMTRHKVATIIWAVIIFTAASVAYMFASTMGELIVISCLLGVGAGLVIPYSKGLIADCFSGKYRMKMMGMVSGVSNISLVIATFAVGWLSKGNWHLPFVVYLICIVPLFFSFRLNSLPKDDLMPDDSVPSAPADVQAAAAQTGLKVVNGFYITRIAQLLWVYFFITFISMVISYYSPYLIQHEHLPTSLTGTVTSIFFLFIFLPGFLLSKIVKLMKGYTMIIAGAMILAGLILFAVVRTDWSMCIGAALNGLGYGISQPMIYDKTSRSVVSNNKSTMALAIVLAANYSSIVLTPFIVDLFRWIFKASPDGPFPFILAAILSVGYVVLTIIRRNSFGFSVNKSFYA